MKNLHKHIISACLIGSLALVNVACSSSPKKESTGEYIDDSVITTKIKALYVQDPVVKALDIKVVTFKNTVQLSGFANSATEIARAVEIAKGVNGVAQVKNDIRLK